MNSYLRNSIAVLLVLVALLALGAGLTQAHAALTRINANFFIVACVFFIVSVLLWLISWAYLIKKHRNIPYSSLLLVGFSSVYGALTPIQLGADALRSMLLKDFFGVSYSSTVSASIIVKGIKFLILAFLASAVLLLFIFVPGNPLFSLGFMSGFAVVLLASLLFLLPLKKAYAEKISSFFGSFSESVPLSGRLSRFFTAYSQYVRKISRGSFLIVLALASLSWVFEFLALQFSFVSLGVLLPLHSLLMLMVIVSVLERTPFLPRGIGLVEVAGYYFLAFPGLVSGYALSVSEIGAVLVAYDVVRLVVPTLLSIGVSVIFLRGQNKATVRSAP